MIKAPVVPMIALAVSGLMWSQAWAGHSGPKREAGKLLAVAEAFDRNCSQVGEIDELELKSRLAELGIKTSDYRSDSGLSDYMAEYLDEYAGFIEENGVREFCEAALTAFADAEPRFLQRLK